MVTSALIFGIVFSIISLIFLVTMVILYLGEKTSLEGFIIMYLALFISLIIAGGLFSSHFKQVNNQTIQQELNQTK